MAYSIWPTVHAERHALLDDVAGLTDTDWASPSLCGEWTVAQVFAHLLSTTTMTPLRFMTRFAGAGFSFGRFTQAQVSREAAAGPVAAVAAFRTAADGTNAPPGPKLSWLGEILVHGEDIRRPLGIRRDHDLPEVTRALTFYAGSNALIGGKSRVAGLTLQPTDTDFTLGSGPLVRGPAMSLLLAATGRSIALDDLTGPGVETLRDRAGHERTSSRG